MLKEQNTLYPIFLKVRALHVLVVGGGNVALEKLTFLFKSSPDAKVHIVAPQFREKTLQMAIKNKAVIYHRLYESAMIEGKHVVIATTDDITVNRQVYKDCRKKSILVNLADTPDCCDFYMGSIVTKGSVKIAISTNGNAPTMAKRLREFFEGVIPDNIDILARNLKRLRATIAGDFEHRVQEMNKMTASLINKSNTIK